MEYLTEDTVINILNEKSISNYKADTSVIRNKIYPIIKQTMDKPASKSAYKKLVANFLSARSQQLYDSLPCDRIICSESEMDELFKVLHIDKKEITELIEETYYGKVANFNPSYAKHEFTVCMLMIIRYFMLNKDQKSMELAMIHLSFSGKFYPSLHYRSYHIAPVRNVMEYVVNNCLSNKFDLVTQGSVIGAIKSVGLTMLSSYKDRLTKLDDEDAVYFIQQLHSRIGSFLKNIATEYYRVYEEKDSYLVYSSDSYDSDDYHLADSDTLRISRITEKTMNSINSMGVNYAICKSCSDSNITPNECKAVIESIVGNPQNVPEMKELISLIVAMYFSSGGKDVSDVKFITSTLAPKPNAKQKELVRIKDIVESWLVESGTAYIRRRSRIATKNSYERAVKMYFTLIIHNSNR